MSRQSFINKKTDQERIMTKNDDGDDQSKVNHNASKPSKPLKPLKSSDNATRTIATQPTLKRDQEPNEEPPSKQPISSLQDLGERRWNDFLMEVGKYGRLIVNDHFAVILLVLFAFIAMYYQRLLAQILAGILGSHVIIIRLFLVLLFVFLMRQGKIIWLTKFADKSFVFPLGKAWRSYWSKGFQRGVILPLFVLIGVYILLLPLLWRLGLVRQPWELYIWPLLLCGGLVLFHSQGWLQSVSSNTLKTWQLSLGHCVMVGSLFFLDHPWNVILASGILLGVGIYTIGIWQASHKASLRFERVIELEEKRERGFYHFISLFAQVPHLPTPVQRLAWLDGLIRCLPGEGHRFAYQYKRQLWRNATYRSIWLNVLIFVAIMLTLSPYVWMLVGWTAIAIILTLSQVVVLMKADRVNPFQQIYACVPDRVQGLRLAIFPIVCLQVVIFSLISVNIWPLLSGSIFIIIGLYVYLPWWYNKHGQAITNP